MTGRALELAQLQREAARRRAEAALHTARERCERASARVVDARRLVSDAIRSLESGGPSAGAVDPRRLLLDAAGLQTALDDARKALYEAQQEEQTFALALQQAQQAFEVARREERVVERARDRRSVAEPDADADAD